MLKIKNNLPIKPPRDAVFETPEINQKLGVEMLITLNTTTKRVLTGPDVDEDMKILVMKDKPNFLFNPKIDSEELNDDGDVCIMNIKYQSYQGNEMQLEISEDLGGEIKQAIDYLNNGRPRKKRNANKS